MSGRSTAASRRARERTSGAPRLLALAAAGALCAPTGAQAQLAVNRLELVLRPHVAAERAGVVTVRNEGNAPVQATVKFEDWDRAEDGTNRWHPLGTLPRSCESVLKVFPLSLSLTPGAEQSVRVSLDSVKAPRQCWSGLVIETVQRNGAGQNSANMILRTAVKLYVEPEVGTLDGAISEMQVREAGTGTSGADRRVELLFENVGTRRSEANGKLEVRRPDDTVVATVQLPTVYTLPGARRRFDVTLPELAPGRYVLLGMLDFGGDEIAAAQLEYEVP